MKVLITGGAGYIGSHTALALRAAGHEPVLLDNFSNSSPGALAALGALDGPFSFVAADVRDARALDGAFESHRPKAVVHLAGTKSSGRSMAAAVRCRANNVAGTRTLMTRMAAHGVRALVFSSTAAVYAASGAPRSEDARTGPATPYARSKLQAEALLRWANAADGRWRIAILRYFNAAGADRRSALGDGLWGTAANLLPRIVEAALGRRACLDIYGADWPTPDGTCVRDYVHVADIARAHVLALGRLTRTAGVSTFNLGAGRGCSVLEVVDAFERVTGRTVPVRVVGRRPGDVAVSCADPARAARELGWGAAFGLDRICEDSWRVAATVPRCREPA